MTLEGPTDKNKPAQKTQGESSKKGEHAELPVPCTSTAVESKPQKPYTHCEITYKTEKDWWDKKKPFVEIAGVVLLFAYTVFAGCQVRVANDTLEEIKNGKKWDRQVARAVSGPKLREGPLGIFWDAKTRELRARVWFQNVGKSDATDASVAIKFDFRTKPPNPDERKFSEFTDLRPNRLIPNSEVKEPTEAPNVTRQISPEQRRAFGAPEMTVYIWGEIRYKDFTGPDWVTTPFCRLAPTIDLFKVGKEGSLDPCE